MQHSSTDLIAAAAAVGVPLPDLPTRVYPERLVPHEGSLNFRELGGIPVDGGVVRRGVLFRSDHLNELTKADAERITGLGLRTVYDFRLPLEQERQPSKLPDGIPVRLLSTGDMAASEAMVTMIPKMLTGEEPIAPATWWDENYVDMLSRAKEMFVALMDGLSSADGVPALYHCTGGKDRTGLATMIILDLLGASKDDIIDDFLSTNVFRTPRRLPHWQPQFEAAGITEAQAMPILGVTRSGIETAIRELGRLGGARQYLLDGGLSNESLDRFCAMVVDPQ
jgi:protein-tyrosine phosphatase